MSIHHVVPPCKLIRPWGIGAGQELSLSASVRTIWRRSQRVIVTAPPALFCFGVINFLCPYRGQGLMSRSSARAAQRLRR